MAGVLVAWFILEAGAYLRHTTATVYSDNSPTVSWTHRLMSRSEHPTSARLLRALAMRARTLETQVPTVPHWAGKDNRPADAASRSYDPTNPHFSHDDAMFLTLFTLSFLLPQSASWQLQQVPQVPLSRLILTLAGQRLPLQLWTYQPVFEIGAFGQPTAPNKECQTRTWEVSPPLSSAPSWWASLPDIVQEALAKATKCEVIPSPQPCDT
jgi:hypothetical protein